MECDRIFFAILGHFLHFYPASNPKNQNFEKMKKRLEVSSFYTSVPKIMIIFYTVPEIWYMTNVISFFFILGIFCFFTPLTVPKIEKFKTEKNTWRYHHFTHVYQKLWSDNVWFLKYSVQQTNEQIEKVTYRGGCPI